jgi:hypothetical protein
VRCGQEIEVPHVIRISLIIVRLLARLAMVFSQPSPVPQMRRVPALRGGGEEMSLSARRGV